MVGMEATPRLSRRRPVLRAAWLAAAFVAAAGTATAADWPMISHDPSGNHSQPDETAISAANVSRLAPHWVLTVAGIVTATPAVVNGAVYFPDSGGKFWKVDARTGRVAWSVSVAELTGGGKASSRTSPAYADGMVFIGANAGAQLIAVDAGTGRKRWMTQLDTHPSALLTGSPVVVGDRIYMPVSSNEQMAAAKPGYACCTFRGSLVALDIHTGKIVWKTYTMPDNGGRAGGFSGGAALAIPAVDAEKGIIWFATDHQYTQPESVVACLAGAADDWKPGCYPPDARFNSLVALDLATGQPKWSFRGSGADVYRFACGTLPQPWDALAKDYTGAGPARYCPPAGDFLDWSFATGSPQLFRATAGGKPRDLVGVGEKSGIYWVFDALTGEPVWHTLIGPYSEPGGITWGAAYDGNRIYVTLANVDHTPYRLASGRIAEGGFWTALDPATGKVVWQTAEPKGALVYAAPVVANGVLYVSSLEKGEGKQLYALDPATGAILWQFSTGGSVMAHPAVADGMVFWGSGAPSWFPEAVGNDKVFGLSVDGR
ncbi:outer membrane protein assembly factor BamB family protein [Rhodopila globiformis]|nr:PQQ-binding-like beta-propeller repeat protein [Rhodopila globiformis]